MVEFNNVVASVYLIMYLFDYVFIFAAHFGTFKICSVCAVKLVKLFSKFSCN